jgi:hypothetical protein
MRALVDIVQNLTNVVRFAIGMLVLFGMVIGLMVTLGGTYVAPKAVESIAERAERAGDKAIVAAQRERIASEMAKDGWGYGAATASAGHPADEMPADQMNAPMADDGWAE